MMILPRRASAVAIALAALALGGCSDSNGGSTGPGDANATIAVNAATAPVYVALGQPATVATVPDPFTSTAWDLEFTATPTVALNGGASGPAGVTGYCVCNNAALTLEQVVALTATEGRAAFDAVTAANIPDPTAFEADASIQAIDAWYDYNPTTHAITTNANVWGIRLASTTGAYAKFHVIAIPTATPADPGPVTLEWATQPSSSGTLGTDRQLVIDLSGGTRFYVNLTTGTASTSSSSTWDIALQGYTISVNGGTSGTGGVAAVPLIPSAFYTSYSGITAIPIGATGIPSTSFVADGAGGAFVTVPPYRYNPALHQVFPTYDVYLVKRGTAVYKVQVTGYYDTTGTFGNLTLRYAKLTD